jgi:hypothetical protein
VEKRGQERLLGQLEGRGETVREGGKRKVSEQMSGISIVYQLVT